MNEQTQIELLKLAAQTAADLAHNKSAMLGDLTYKAKAACVNKETSDYEMLVNYLYQLFKRLIEPVA